MRILISNDDGYRARGIVALREALEGLGDLTVSVTAPLKVKIRWELVPL